MEPSLRSVFKMANGLPDFGVKYLEDEDGDPQFFLTLK